MQELSQETIAIIGVGAALAAIVLASIAGLRADLRAVQAEARAGQEVIRKESREAHEAIRKESQESVAAIRTESRADREAFAGALLRLTEQYGVLHGSVQGLLRAQSAGTDATAPAGDPER